MKLIALLPPVFALGAVAIGSLSEYIEDLPSCSIQAFKSALEAEGCYQGTVGTHTFDCMCANIPGVTTHMTGNVKEQCLEDWVGAFGGACGIYDSYSTTASDWPQATSVLAKDFSGSGGTETTPASATKSPSSAASGSASSGSAPSDSAAPSAGAATPTETNSGASSSAEAATPISTSSDDAGPTMMPKVLGVVGGAAVAVAPFLI